MPPDPCTGQRKTGHFTGQRRDTSNTLMSPRLDVMASPQVRQIAPLHLWPVTLVTHFAKVQPKSWLLTHFSGTQLTEYFIYTQAYCLAAAKPEALISHQHNGNPIGSADAPKSEHDSVCPVCLQRFTLSISAPVRCTQQQKRAPASTERP